MNERIKELWVQAAEKTQGDSWEEQTKFIERFAELIVKECVSKVTKVSDSIKEFDSGNADGIDLCDLITHHIKKHFGVN